MIPLVRLAGQLQQQTSCSPGGLRITTLRIQTGTPPKHTVHWIHKQGAVLFTLQLIFCIFSLIKSYFYPNGIVNCCKTNEIFGRKIYQINGIALELVLKCPIGWLILLSADVIPVNMPELCQSHTDAGSTGLIQTQSFNLLRPSDA